MIGDLISLSERTKGFATLVISGGAIAYVGAQWPIQDLSAALFGAAFYQQLMSGARVGDAMLYARRACAKGEFNEALLEVLPTNIIPEALVSEVTWANFVLYGQPLKRFIQTQAAGGNEDFTAG